MICYMLYGIFKEKRKNYFLKINILSRFTFMVSAKYGVFYHNTYFRFLIDIDYTNKKFPDYVFSLTYTFSCNQTQQPKCFLLKMLSQSVFGQ